MSEKNIGSRSVHAVGWGMSSQLISQVFSFIFGIALARLLVPDDFGLIAMVLVFSGFASLMADVGLGSALIQKEDAKQEHFNSVFWVNILLGSFMTLLLFFLSPWLGEFYGRPEVEKIAQLLSLTYVISAFALVPRTRLVKKLQIKYLAITEFIGMVVAGVVAVYMAMYEYGYWSLVVHRFLQTLISSVLICVYGGWRPNGWGSKSALKELLGFSANVFATRTLHYLAGNVDKLLIGKLLGGASLGLYDKAISMMLFPLQNISNTIGKVMFPVLSIIQSDKERVKSTYLRSVSAIALLTFPMMTGMFVASEAFVLGFLGEKWVEVIPILKILCVAGIIRSIVTVTGSLYQSQGKAGLQLRVNLIMKPIAIVFLLAGLTWGVVGVAVGVTIATIINASITLTVAGRLVGLRLVSLLGALLPTFLCAIVMAVSVWFVRVIVNFESELTLFFIQFLVGIITYLACIIGARLESYRDVVGMILKEIKSRRDVYDR